jgi:hypothetical protein
MPEERWQFEGTVRLIVDEIADFSASECAKAMKANVTEELRRTACNPSRMEAPGTIMALQGIER